MSEQTEAVLGDGKLCAAAGKTADCINRVTDCLETLNGERARKDIERFWAAGRRSLGDGGFLNTLGKMFRCLLDAFGGGGCPQPVAQAEESGDAEGDQ